jgi:hypothetical protein
MPHYKALVQFKALNAAFTDTIHITIEANNAIEAKALLQDQYGEGAMQTIQRQDALGGGNVKVLQHATTASRA